MGVDTKNVARPPRAPDDQILYHWGGVVVKSEEGRVVEVDPVWRYERLQL